MKFQLLTFSLLLVAFLFQPISSLAQDDMGYPADPSPEHAVLKMEVGVWDVEISMMGPTGEMKSKGVETTTMLGELWSSSTLEYDFMGKPTIGHGVIGYDPAQEKYLGTWHEAGNPYKSDMVGTYDSEAKKMTYAVSGKDHTGAANEMKIVVTFVDKTHKTMEMLMSIPESGSDDLMSVMTMNYTKRANEGTR